MPFYRDHIYPYLVSHFGNPPPIQKIRRALIPLARGDVLEIGVGAGANLIYYDSTRVKKLFALEPNLEMIRRAERERIKTTLLVEYLDLPGEQIPLAGESVDTVVSTFTLCTIAGVQDAIREIRRVLKPNGSLLFFELTVAPNAKVRRWQAWWEPLHQRAFEGLYLTRDIPALLRDGGFALQDLQSGYLSPFPKSWSHGCWGIGTS